MCVSLKICSVDAIIGVINSPPNMNYFFLEFHRLLCEICTHFPNYCVHILSHSEILLSLIYTGSRNPSQQVRAKLICFFSRVLIFYYRNLLLIPRHTSSTANIIDLVVTNNPDVCSDIINLEGISDHDVITGCIIGSFNKKGNCC